MSRIMRSRSSSMVMARRTRLSAKGVGFPLRGPHCQAMKL
jgi:hypothetical protein